MVCIAIGNISPVHIGKQRGLLDLGQSERNMLDILPWKDTEIMKKLTLAAFIIGSFLLFSFLYNHPNNAIFSPPATTGGGTSDSSSISVSPGPSGTIVPGATYKDGTYIGSVADAQWGNVQIQVVIQQGKLTNVSFLQYPDDRNRSVMINNYADPQLISEAIQAQSANVDTVTGATDSSDAFIQSLTDALSQAKA
jgi:uncharacterized protein with FMN-binding domain